MEKKKTKKPALNIVTACRDRREHQPGHLWISEDVNLPIRPDRRQSIPLVHVLTDMREQAIERDFNGLAAVLLRNDGGYDLIVAGEAMREQSLLLGGTRRLNDLLAAMKGKFDDYF